jgi:transcriptional repressor NrdR
LRCPFCKKDDDRVVDSRSSADGEAIRRRRECLSCKKRYTTYEVIEEGALRVEKKDGSREAYDRKKLLNSFRKACEKRPVSTQALEAAVDDIEKSISTMFEREVGTRFIGEEVMKHLRKLDHVAYVRFASVYRDFKEVSEFVKEVELLNAEERAGKSA